MPRITFMALVILVATFSGNSLAAQPKRSLRNLDLLKPEYPRAFFFRGQAGKMNWSYGKWDKTFNRLGGIIGKTLNEEIPGREESILYFTRFKKNHPRQIVLLHYNGNARDPRNESWKFAPNHWLYFEGTDILQNIPAEKGITEIKVKDLSIFKIGIGRYDNASEDIGLARISEDGKPDWSYSEQVQLVSVDKAKGTIKVRRGQYRTKPRVFEMGKAIAAPHVYEGPWGKNNNLMWLYNHSTECPKDSLGRTANDILVEELAKKFQKNGQLEMYDGIEFDVLRNEISHQTYGRVADVNNDGVGDRGIVDGVNVYSAGVFNFTKKLREAIGDGKLILADGMTPGMQRGFGYLNGIESEGWPVHRDPQVKDWSGGWNRHLFWNQNSFQPSFSYINLKYVRRVRPQPLSRKRLVMAAAPLLDAGIADGGIKIPDQKVGIFDEFLAGTKQEKYWLGRPVDETVQLALLQPDLLEGSGREIAKDFLDRMKGENISFVKGGNSVKISSDSPGKMTFQLQNVPADGPDLVVSMKVRAEDRKAYPEGMARLLNGWRSNDTYKLMTWVNKEWFHATFYFRDIHSDSVNLFFEVESNEPLWLSDVTAHAHPDAVYREFQNGMVLLNPAHHRYAFDLNRISPGKKYKRIEATPHQDQDVNSGEPVDDTVILGERTGLFLEKSNSEN